MAGWDDLAVTAGEIERGYIFDVNLLNTFIRAVNERGFYCGFDGGNNNPETGPSGRKPLKEMPEGESLINFKVIDSNNLPLTTGKDYVSPLFYRVGQMMKRTWVHQETWDDPLSVTGVTDDLTSFWSLQEIEDLITKPYFDIFTDPYHDGIKLSDFQSAGIYNAIYKLFEEVFLYIDITDMGSDLFRDEDTGKSRGFQLTFKAPDDNIEGADLGELNTFTDVTYKNDYDTTALIEAKFNLNDPARGFFNPQILSWSENINANVSYNPGPDTYIFRLRGLGFSSPPGTAAIGYDVVLNSLNHDGDIIELERKEAIWVNRNCVQDFQRIGFFPFPNSNLAFSQNRPEYPQVNIGAAPVRVLVPPAVSSFIDVDGWHFVTEYLAQRDYNLQFSNFAFPVGPAVTSEQTFKSNFFQLDHTATNEVDADTYYNLNVEGMVYNTLPA